MPVGVVTVTTALPAPDEQSTDTTGAGGIGSGSLIVTGAVAGEMHPSMLVTVKVHVPDGTPVSVLVVPIPVVVNPPGIRVRVHIPVEGNPLNPTLPVATAQVG